MDVKSNLKEARDAIKAKQYNVALKLSREVLKEDKSNYMALLFSGISLQEVGPATEAPKYFEKAIALNATNILAYQGLASFYEKFNTDQDIDALIKVYKSLLKLETNENKILETIRKLALHRETKFDKVIDALHEGVNNKNLSDVFRQEACSIVLNLLCSKDDISSFYEIYQDCYFIVKPEERKKEFYYTFFRILYDNKNFEMLVKECESMRQYFPSNVNCLEWICILFNQFYIENNEKVVDLKEKAVINMETILDSCSENPTALFTKSIILYTEGNVLECKEILEKDNLCLKESPHFVIFLTKIYLELHFNKEAIQTATRASNLLENQNRHSKELQTILDECLIKSYCYSEQEEQLKKVIELSSKSTGDFFLEYLIIAYINLKDFIEAQITLEKLSSNRGKYEICKAKILIAQSKHESALQLLESNVQETSTYWLTLGDLYWTLEKYQKSLTSFLKAAKLDQNSYICFERLGNFYQKVEDFDKARRCYEKSFKINGKYKNAGIELSKMYRKLQKWEENLNLLLNLTTDKINTENSWAFVQLGIHYLEQKDFNRAIDTLRLIIRFEPNNTYYWESLADAYLYRGAYNSALKSYEKCAEIMPEALYPKLQIANIKKSIGEYKDAKEEFLSVLKVDSNYVPALKGLAETYFLESKNYKRIQLHGLARDYAQKAIEFVTTALRNTSNLSCLWKICADCCYLVAHLPEKYSFLLVNSALAKGTKDQSNVGLMNEELYQLAARCYCKALSINEDNVFIYHDLACCYLSHAKITEENSGERKELLQKALSVIQHCTNNNPTYWQHWNLLGNVAFCLEPKNLSLAQHAFIKAVHLEHNSALAWNNLGTLYLYLKDIKLANEAFSQAQRSDPNYVSSWVGQALIAEMADVDEAMDLFRHTTQLGQHQQGALGYGYWVCKTLIENPENTNIYSIYNMHAIPIACDSLTWYTDNNPYDPCAWNMLGILRERMGLKKGAWEAFKNAAKYSQKDASLVNLGRSLVNLGQYKEAISCYNKIQEQNFNGYVGLALAYFKNEDFENSYETYKEALKTENQQFQSDLLVALASMTYLFQGPEHAKSLLFQSTQLDQRSPWSLYATSALGLLHEDTNLAHLALNEIEELKDNMDCLPHYATLLTYTWLQQDDYKRAIGELSKLVHRYPNQATLWLSLSILLLRVRNVKAVTKAVAKCANAAMKLGRTDIDMTNVLSIVSSASFLAGDFQGGRKAIQSAIHCYPNVKHGWTLLKCALSCN